MIKKDIDNRKIMQASPNTHDELSSVDDIFAAADTQMAEQAQTSTVQFKKKKKRHPIRNKIIIFIVSLLIIISTFVFVAAKSIIDAYPQMKQQVLEHYSELRQQLSAIDDDELTTDEYYQKRLLLLFTDEDLENMMVDVDGLGSLLKAIASSGEIDVSMIPQDKVDEYKKLYEEYMAAKSAESTNQSEAITNSTEPTTSTNPTN